ncbi:MAG TPA: methyltransferase domain-containing protein [Mycobacteriales bacterium]|nr:methyltransferase domain-containing protein [Mycobacteriales bacterium]
MSGLEPPRVSPEEYDEEYYRTACAGHDEWVASGGAGQANLYKGILKRSGLAAGMTVCDIGAGRGELVALAAEHGARWALGVEYSPAAVRLAAQSVAQRGVADRATVVHADARRLPLPDACVDLVFMIDVIEHLAPAELAATFADAHRVLRPGGRLFAHTFPTRTIYDVTYRSMRVAARAAGRSWPADPRNDYEHRMHVNEQTRRDLRRSLRGAGFRDPSVGFGEWLYTDFVPSERGRAAYRWLAKHRLTKPLAVADLWVDAAR